jgi:hypothetical protein
MEPPDHQSSIPRVATLHLEVRVTDTVLCQLFSLIVQKDALHWLGLRLTSVRAR